MAREKVLTGSLGNCEPLYSVRLTRSNSGRTARTHHLVPWSTKAEMRIGDTWHSNFAFALASSAASLSR